MGLHALEPQRLVGHMAQGPRRALVAADPGVAVLALVDVLLLQPQAFDGGAVDRPGGHKADHAAAVAADLRTLQ